MYQVYAAYGWPLLPAQGRVRIDVTLDSSNAAAATGSARWAIGGVTRMAGDGGDKTLRAQKADGAIFQVVLRAARRAVSSGGSEVADRFISELQNEMREASSSEVASMIEGVIHQYLHSEALRREIAEGLNVVEHATDFVFFARRGEMATNRREDHEISMLGNACVSTDDQTLDLQRDALKKAKCRAIYEEQASGKNTARPQVEACLKSLREGDSLIVWRLDRLGRSLGDLIRLTQDFKSRGARSRRKRRAGGHGFYASAGSSNPCRLGRCPGQSGTRRHTG